MIIHGSGNRKLISQKPPRKITYEKIAAGIFPCSQKISPENSPPEHFSIRITPVKQHPQETAYIEDCVLKRKYIENSASKNVFHTFPKKNYAQED